MANKTNSGGGKLQFGNVSNSTNLSNLFGGGNTFNLGAGSSSFEVQTNSVDMSSLFRDESTNTTRDEISGGGFDAALSLGVGMGGSGSGGDVMKTTTSSKSDNSTLTAGNKSSSQTPLYVALGVFGVGFLMLLIFRKRKK